MVQIYYIAINKTKIRILPRIIRIHFKAEILNIFVNLYLFTKLIRFYIRALFCVFFLFQIGEVYDRGSENSLLCTFTHNVPMRVRFNYKRNHTNQRLTLFPKIFPTLFIRRII